MKPEPSPLTPVEIAIQLRSTVPVLRAALHGLPSEVYGWRPETAEWCINEVIGHIIEADRNGFAGRVRTILAENHPQLALWDIGGLVEQRRDCERDLPSLLLELEEGREQDALLVQQLRPDQLARMGVHPLVGELRVSDILHEWLHHDRRHLKQILSNVQAYVWPGMGNTQRFSQADTLKKLVGE